MKTFLTSAYIAFAVVVSIAASRASAAAPPNFILVFIDDMGYGDLGCFGSTIHRTPNIDRMAAEGIRLTDFYSSCSVCTPSRASLMTGCYPRRVNMHIDEKNRCVLFEGSIKGLNPAETTVAEVLKAKGYATICIGKWHLGDHPRFMPTAQGFDAYFGIPYSNDMGRRKVPLPLVRGVEAIEAPVEQSTLTKRYTEETIGFIKAHKDEPFFIYLPHTMVHLPLHASEAFAGKSKNGKYGDAVEELDWSMGEIFKTLKDCGIDDNTLVLFTTDNGSYRDGSNDPLRGRKGRTDEGGMRVPCIVRFPGRIPAGRTSGEVTTTLDVLPTFAALADGKLPDGPIDGKNIWPILTGEENARSPHEAFFYYQMDQLQAVRSGKWKLLVELESKKRNWGKPEGPQKLKLIDLAKDIHEDTDVSEAHPEVVARLLKHVEAARIELGDGDRKGNGQREAGWVETPAPRLLNK